MGIPLNFLTPLPRKPRLHSILPAAALTFACALVAGSAAYAQAGGRGVIAIGQTADFSGPQAAPVKEATAAAKAYFDKVNADGGINGRKIVLESLDDGFDPKRTVENAGKLIAESNVLALFLTRGTANAEALIPLLADRKVPLFAPVGGSKLLHDPPQRYLFNLRPQFRTEVERIVAQLAAMGIKQIAVVYTDDAFGKDAFEGAKSGFAAQQLQPVVTVSTPRGEPKVAEAVAAITKANPQAVIGICIAKTCAELVKQLRQKGSTAQFVSLSNTSAGSYVDQLGEFARGVMVSQVFPYPDSSVMAVVNEFQQLVKSAQLKSTYTSMEGFVAAKVLTEALRRAGANPTRESLVNAFESMRKYDLGGFAISYGPQDRSGSAFVELSMISKNGKFIR